MLVHIRNVAAYAVFTFFVIMSWDGILHTDYRLTIFVGVLSLLASALVEVVFELVPWPFRKPMGEARDHITID